MKKWIVLGLLATVLLLSGCVKSGTLKSTWTTTPTVPACTQDFNPVCGSDGQTYYNACYAEQAGISVASTGSCSAGGGGGGGFVSGFGYWSP